MTAIFPFPVAAGRGARVAVFVDEAEEPARDATELARESDDGEAERAR